jgi:signal transduction histidine kinase
MRTNRTTRWVALILLLTVLVLVPAMPVLAQDGDPPHDGDGGNGDDDDGGGSIVQNIIHTIIFPIDSLKAALEQSIIMILRGTFEDLEALYEDAFSSVAFGQYVRGPETEQVQPLWARVLYVAMVLWPVTLGLNVVMAARGGVAVTAAGYADLKEALVEWVASCVAAAASLFVLRWCMELTHHVSGMLMPASWHDVARAIAHSIADVGIVEVVARIIPGGSVFILVFFLALGFAFMVGLCLAFIARYVILFVLMVIAPFVMTLGAVPPTRWLSWLWVKGTVIALLIYPANAIMIAVAFRVAATGAIIIRLLAMIGVLSVIIALNFAVVQAVFGAAAQIVRKAKATAEQVVAMATLAVGAVGLAAAGGAGAAAGAGPIVGGGAGGGAAAADAGASGPLATSGAKSGEVEAASAAASSSGGGAKSAGATRARSALTNPQVLKRLGGVGRTLGRGIQMTSRGPIGRAVGAVVEGAGGLASDVGQEGIQEQRDGMREAAAAARAGEAEERWDERDAQRKAEYDERARSAQLRDRYRPQYGFLVQQGLDPSGEHFWGVADAMQRLEKVYSPDHGDAMRDSARSVATMMAAAQGRGQDLASLARGAGYSDPGAMFGSMVEERLLGGPGAGGFSIIPGNAGGGAAGRIFSGTAGVQAPGDWQAGWLDPHDWVQGLQVAELRGQARLPEEIERHAQQVHAIRGSEGPQDLSGYLSRVRGEGA